MQRPEPASLAALVERVESSITAGTDWVTGCRGAFRAFLAEARGVATSRLNRVLAAIDTDPAHQSKGWDLKQVVLAECDSFALLCSVFDEPLDHIYSSPFEALIGVLGPANLMCDRYLLPRDHDPLILEADKRLTYAETLVVKPHEYVALDGFGAAYDFYSFGPTILVRLFMHTTDPLHHIYDRATLKPWLVQAGDPSSTQVACLAKALAELGDKSSLAVLQDASRHPHHFVRWAAIQSMSVIDPSKGLERVRTALDDAHPDIRDAARRSLERAAAIRGEGEKDAGPWH